MKLERQLVESLATLLARYKMSEVIEEAFGQTGEYTVLNVLCHARQPVRLNDFARSRNLTRASLMSYVKGSRRYEGVLRAALKRLLEKGMVEEVEGRGSLRYRLNTSHFSALLLGEIISARLPPPDRE